MRKLIKTKEYGNFLLEVKERIRNAQYQALKKVNKELIGLYWDIGRMIVNRQGQHKWGRAVVENLANDLQEEFPGLAGFSKDNIWRMRKFYLNFKDNTKLAPLVQEIAWSHNIVIMEKGKDALEREFYIRMKVFRVKEEALYASVRGRINIARMTAVSLARECSGLTYGQIARIFGGIQYKSAAKYYERIKQKCQTEGKFCKLFNRLKERCSQGET